VKVVALTGASAGVGRAAALAFAHKGADVGLIARGRERLEAAKREIEALGRRAVIAEADVADAGAVEAAARQIEDELGPVDVWVNNAGVQATEQAARIADRARDGRPLDALVRLPDEEWRRMLAVHLDGTFYGTRAAAASMAARGDGAIVNIASVCGIEGCTGYPHYSAAKAGILGFTRAVAKELATQGIRVNAVAPGFIDTEASRRIENRLRDEQRRRTPLGRFGRPEEIAATVAFLAGDDAAFFVGATLSPNGGIVTV
jgi:3-oxoacyl-[acyl-carrier protein] reductase